jgi:hypothetical protein
LDAATESPIPHDELRFAVLVAEAPLELFSIGEFTADRFLSEQETPITCTVKSITVSKIIAEWS